MDRIDGSGGKAGILAQLRHVVSLFSVAVGVVLAAVVVVGAVATLWLQPRLEDSTDLIRAVREHHGHLLGEHAALRAWLTTGDEAHLARARAARREAAAVAAGPQLGAAGQPKVVSMLVAQQRWSERWADQVRDIQPITMTRTQLRAQLLDGEQLFVPYQEAQARLITELADERDELMDTLQAVLIGGTAGAAALMLGLLVAVRRIRRRAHDEFVEPLQGLVDTIDLLGAGDLTASPPSDGPAELRRISSGLSAMADALSGQREELARQQARAEAAADALRDILTVAREIAGSQSTRYVAESVVGVALRLGQADRARIWMTDLSDDQTLHLLHDSDLPRGAAPSAAPIQLGDGPVGAAAHEVRPVRTDRAAAYPLAIGGRVIGVLELQREPGRVVSEVAREALETLAIQSGAALQAARLHHQAQELSQVDALTGLANRRRLEADLAVELERARRYERPLGFVMADIDHFKAVNDTHGHQHGDAVLRLIADVLAGELRSSDSLYRYGGEEFVILARESDATATAELAQRLRAAAEARSADRGQGVTLSFGVAAAPEHASSVEELVGLADRALYLAKSAGRNRVEVAAWSETTASRHHL